MNRNDFVKDLAALINTHSIENISNTPDWILADYLVDCLDNYHKIDTAKKRYYQPAPTDLSLNTSVI